MTPVLRSFLAMCALVLAPDALATTVYKCTNADGAIAYQATPCTGQQQSQQITLRDAAPAATPSATVAPPRKASRSKPARAPVSTRRNRRSDSVAAAPSSWECRAGNGEVFYQHAPCPSGVTASTAPARSRGRAAAALTPVSARAISRDEACRRIHAASAGSRAGHQRDEDVSTYERNLGRDPCR